MNKKHLADFSEALKQLQEEQKALRLELPKLIAAALAPAPKGRKKAAKRSAAEAAEAGDEEMGKDPGASVSCKCFGC